MAKKRVDKGDKSVSIDPKLMDRLWVDIAPEEWVDAILRYNPSSRVTVNGRVITTTCCYHEGDASPSMFLNLDRRLVKCFSAQCGKYEKDPVNIWAHLGRMTVDKAIRDIKTRYNISLLSKEKIAALVELDDAYQVHELFLKICNRALLMAIADESSPYYEVGEVAVKYLYSRKVSHITENMPLGIIPTERLVDSLITEMSLEVPMDLRTNLTSFFAQVRDITFLGQLVFAYRSEVGKIRNFKIRLVRTPDNQRAIDTKDFRSIYHPVLKAQQSMPAFFGSDYYKDLLGIHKELYLVEGEFDYLSVVQAQLRCDEPRKIFMAVGGSSTRDLDGLNATYDLSRAYLLFDAPSAKGDDLAQGLIDSAEGIVSPYVYKWEAEGPVGKDPDDILSSAEDPTIAYRHFINPDNYLAAEDFYVRRIQQEIGGRQSSTLEKHTIVKDHCMKIANPILARIVLKKCQELFGVIQEEILRSMVLHSDDESLFIQRIADLIKSRYKILGHVPAIDGESPRLVLWSYSRPEMITIDTSSTKEITGHLCKDFGSLLTAYENEIGIPAIYRNRSTNLEALDRTRIDRDNDVRRATVMAMQDLLKGTPSLNLDNKYTGGIYYLPDRDLSKNFLEKEVLDTSKSPADVYRWYILNDYHLFVATPDKNGGMQFKRHSEPLVNGHLFDLNPQYNAGMSGGWSDYAINEYNLNHCPHSLRETLERTRRIISKCFILEHDVDYKIVSLLCLYAAIHALFPRKVFTALCGETSSGKSRIGEGIFGGKVSRYIYLVEAVINMSHYTEAGLRQFINGKSLMVTLDEFEDTGKQNDDKSNIVRRILETVRTAETNTVVVKGTPDGHSKTFTIQAPLLTMAIRQALAPADLNRFVGVSTVKVKNHQDAEDIAKELYTIDEMADIRHSNLVAPLMDHKKILDYYLRIKDETKRVDHPLRHIPFRTLSQILILASIEAAAFDDINKGYDLLKEYHIQRKQQIQEVVDVGLTRDIWDEVFRSPYIRIRGPESDVTDTIMSDKSLEMVLRNPAWRDQLLSGGFAGMGLHVTDHEDITKRKYFVIMAWNSVRKTVFGSGEFRSKPPAALRSLADRDSNVLPKEKWDTVGLTPSVLRSKIGAATYISVYDCTSYIIHEE